MFFNFGESISGVHPPSLLLSYGGQALLRLFKASAFTKVMADRMAGKALLRRASTFTKVTVNRPTFAEATMEKVGGREIGGRMSE